MNQPQNGNGTLNDIKDASSAARDKVVTGVKTAAHDAQDYLSEAGDKANEAISEARTRFEDSLRNARIDLRKLEDTVLAHSRDAARQADVYVHDNPWKAVGIGAAIGLLAGLLVSRR
ncbi:ElaB/YqjD/DUF883 family membrane-anchored ribosome-binding protein [Duganella sp. 3397]|uniref:DUF883 domain-containing protein n=1 Tax=Duganella phyllosphaerae TaxID=762836 RepID=A0A1E7WIM1_9BURK|nr:MULTISPECIES: DUF883 family protein [Duganella]MDR7051878.1 ElaB/YqjD/DUF883 family membrane-anchored ribosome-binding protein [Duganella sp. 3397]OEZ98479.1 hypothetical protein DUPY_31580 [Duganella phyllosphaerae]